MLTSLCKDRADSPLLREAGRGRDPTRKRWEGEGHPCYLPSSDSACLVNRSESTYLWVAQSPHQETDCPSPSHCVAMGPSLSPLRGSEGTAASTGL